MMILEKKHQEAISEGIVEKVVREVTEKIKRYYHENPYDFVEPDGTISLREDEIFAQEFHRHTEDWKDADLDVDIVDIEQLEDIVWEKLDPIVFDEVRDSLHEELTEQKAYEKNPLHYHGLSIWDFV